MAEMSSGAPVGSVEFCAAVRTILRGFDERVFVVSTENSHSDPIWIWLAPFIQALAVAQRATADSHLTRLTDQLCEALFDLQEEPDCWCAAGSAALAHSPACAAAQRAVRAAIDTGVVGSGVIQLPSSRRGISDSEEIIEIDEDGKVSGPILRGPIREP